MVLECRHIAHRFGRQQVLHDVSIRAEAGQITGLLGPSGCGKTTLLRLIAGLLALQEGEVLLDGQTMVTAGRSPRPENLPVGLVFQDGALFPHLNVGENIRFGLKGQEKTGQRERELLQRIDLKGYARRYPHTLSGGQQQRVALARALAPAPRVLLLDEPFANIDVTLRRSLRQELRTLLCEAGVIAILVTHDPEEALEMADSIAIFEGGEILQQASPRELYAKPASPDIARAVCGAQIIEGALTDEGLQTPFGIWPRDVLQEAGEQWGPLILGVRSQGFEPGGGGYLKKSSIIDKRHTGSAWRIVLAGHGGVRLIIHLPPSLPESAIDLETLRPSPGSVLGFTAR